MYSHIKLLKTFIVVGLILKVVKLVKSFQKNQLGTGRGCSFITRLKKVVTNQNRQDLERHLPSYVIHKKTQTEQNGLYYKNS